MTAPLPDFYVMRVKDIQSHCGIGKHAARKILQDIKEWIAEIKKTKGWDTVLYFQFKHYFALNG